MRRTHSVLSVFMAAICGAAFGVGGCDMPAPNDAEIGCAYDARSSPSCPGVDAGSVSADASGDSNALEAAPVEEGSAGEGGASGLGNSCTGQADCAGLSTDYCLVSPTGAFSSFCTYTHCTEAACGTSYVCCDCTKSPVSLVNAFPAGICVLPVTAAALPSYGCTCMPQAQ
jgi:hypothetical protein